jgi:outer membrane lipoprotein SlyB
MEINQAPGSTYQPAFSDRMRHSKALVAIVAVLGVTVLALAAALVVNRSEAQPGPAGMAPLALSEPAPTKPAPAKPVVHAAPVTAPAKVAATAPPKPAYHPNNTNVYHPAPAVVARANVCSDCGTVESVHAIKRQGQVNGVAVGDTTIGLGTVAGGVLGGLLGNQVGGGNGKTAMTVLGAAGGAYAGNKVEQNMKSVTVYDVRVRMNDGSVRNLEVSSPIAVGARVTVEGKNLRLATAAG